MKWTSPAIATYNFYEELLEQKHLMIAGATGSGKSVIVNGIIYTALSRFPFSSAGGATFILIDPKRVELVDYKDLPHTILYASEPDEMVRALQIALNLVEDRYREMQQLRIKQYHGGDTYIIIDEFADLMTTNRRKVAPLIQRIAQIGRAAKVHIILCTQCPIAKVIPTEIKCNFDSIIGLHTRSKQDSRNILGYTGCERLPQYGECYYMAPGYIRHYTDIPMIEQEKIQLVIDHWLNQYELYKKEKEKK